MHATEMSERSILLALPARRTGIRNPFAVAGVIESSTTGRAGSGCVTVIVAVRVSASGGTTRVKSPAEIVPPSSPIVFVASVVVDEPRSPSPRPRIWDELPVPAGVEGLDATGDVGRLEQPAAARSTARPITSGRRWRRGERIADLLEFGSFRFSVA